MCTHVLSSAHNFSKSVRRAFVNAAWHEPSKKRIANTNRLFCEHCWEKSCSQSTHWHQDNTFFCSTTRISSTWEFENSDGFCAVLICWAHWNSFSFIINIRVAVNIRDINKMYCLMERGHLPSACLHENNLRPRTSFDFADHTQRRIKGTGLWENIVHVTLLGPWMLSGVACGGIWNVYRRCLCDVGYDIEPTSSILSSIGQKIGVLMCNRAILMCDPENSDCPNFHVGKFGLTESPCWEILVCRTKVNCNWNNPTATPPFSLAGEIAIASCDGDRSSWAF